MVGLLSPHRWTSWLCLGLHVTWRYLHELVWLPLSALLLHLLLSGLFLSLCSKDCYESIPWHVTKLLVHRSSFSDSGLRYRWHSSKHIRRRCVSLLPGRTLCQPKIHRLYLRGRYRLRSSRGYGLLAGLTTQSPIRSIRLHGVKKRFFLKGEDSVKGKLW